MRFVILTGISGAGKSTALKMMEDMGYYCVDNLPIPLVERFFELSDSASTELQKVAVGIDARNGKNLGEMHDVLKRLHEEGRKCEILFLDADDPVLVKRYKETRRSHPLAYGDRVDKGITREREHLKYLKDHADYIILLNSHLQFLKHLLQTQLLTFAFLNIFLKMEYYSLSHI